MKNTLLTCLYVSAIFAGASFLNSCQKTVCDNSCSYAYDGTCDDGGTGASFSVCDCGTDCNDCGERKKGSGPGGITQSCK